MNAQSTLVKTCLLGAVLLHALTSGAQPVTQIAAGNAHSLFLKGDGSAWAMGYNGYGQLGDGINDTSFRSGTNRPERIVVSNVMAIAAGGEHTLILKDDGSLWAAGDNDSGELGDDSYNGTYQLEQIIPTNVIAIAAGGHHSLFLTSDGRVWAMGLNYYGQLGVGNSAYPSTNQPAQSAASNVTAIATGYNHSLFIESNGSLWGMGYNSDGELGDGSYMTNSPYETNQPEQIVASNVVAVAGGDYHSLFLKRDGSLWAMGGNFAYNNGPVNSGQLGDGTYNNTNRPEIIVASNVVAVAAGAYHSLFLKSDGSLWGMGYNADGELGDGTYNNTNRPEMIVPSGVTAIGAGAGHSLFLKSDGSLWAMGADFYGQLGDGTYPPYPSAVNRPEQIVIGPPGFNQITGQLLNGGNMRLSFVGLAGANYALDWATSLTSANWLPVATNPANSFGTLIFTNTPNPNQNNFWRIRSVR